MSRAIGLRRFGRDVPGQYDSTGRPQAVKGICRADGNCGGLRLHVPVIDSVWLRAEVDVTVNATDKAGNDVEETYYFYTVMRSFGTNAKVNSDSGTAVQDNPAVATDPDGNIWVAWDQRTTADTDIYIAKLPADGNAFGPLVLIYNDSRYQSNPAVAVDQAGKLYVVWEQWSATDPNHHIMMASSTDGIHWVADPCTPPQRVDPLRLSRRLSL